MASVYIAKAQCRFSDKVLYKIGMSSADNPLKRVLDISVGLRPFAIVTDYAFFHRKDEKDAMEMENITHLLFRYYKFDGEWFDLPDVAVRFIDHSVCDGWFRSDPYCLKTTILVWDLNKIESWLEVPKNAILQPRWVRLKK